MKTDRKLVVSVKRGWDGSLYSEICYHPFTDTRRDDEAVVIDREKKRGPIDGRTLKARAENLSKLLGLELLTDLTWPCYAMRGLACRCPKCMQSI